MTTWGREGGGGGGGRASVEFFVFRYDNAHNDPCFLNKRRDQFIVMLIV